MARMSVIGGTGRSGTTDPTRGYANQDGPGNTTVDYGPHRGGFTPPSQPTSYVDHATPFYDAAQTPEALAAYNQRVSDAMSGYSGYQSGNIKDHINALMQAKGDMQRQRFMDQGGQGETWDNRYSNENNWPRPTSSIGYSHGPGRPDYPTRGTNQSPYGPGNTAPPMRGGSPPATVQSGGMDGPSSLPGGRGGAGPMPGGRYGGAGVTSGPGGWSSAGGYHPGASTGSQGLYGDPSLYDSPMGGPPGGGMPPQILQQMLIASQMGQGGYSPQAAGMGGMNSFAMGRGMYGSGGMGGMFGRYRPGASAGPFSAYPFPY